MEDSYENVTLNTDRVPNVSPDVLNPTELWVTKLISAGCSTDAIAERLSGGTQAVERLYEEICHKVGVTSRTGLILWACRFDVARWEKLS